MSLNYSSAFYDQTKTSPCLVASDGIYTFSEEKCLEGKLSSRIWHTNGSVKIVNNLRKISDRTLEEITVIKIENATSPFDLTSVDESDVLHLILPYSLRYSIAGTDNSLLDKEVALGICARLFYSTVGFNKLIYRELLSHMRNSNKTKVMFKTFTDEANSDLVLLSKLYQGHIELEQYDHYMLSSNWGWNISIFSNILAELKCFYFLVRHREDYNLLFFNKIFELRTKMLEGVQ